MGKNFLGLDGLSHFWSKAKTWIIDRITTEVTAKIAEIVANAPKDLDTLKEIADWISTHEDSASAMNTEILANTEAISGKADKIHTHTKSEITDFDHTHDDRYYTESEIDTKLSGKSDTGHTHTKSQITDFPTSLPANGGTADKIKPNYTRVDITTATSNTIKYIKVADCIWSQAGTLEVYLDGNNLLDTLVINFGGGNSETPMLCGYYNGNSHGVYSVIAQKGSSWNSYYSIYVKVRQMTTLSVNVALLKGDCTINITESITAPTNIFEWPVRYGLFGNITAPEITDLEQRIAALESKI